MAGNCWLSLVSYFISILAGYSFGEILDGHYEILAAHEKGVFSNVIRAKDFKARPGDPEEVAIKNIRNNDMMYKAGTEELVILKKLVSADPEDKRHCVTVRLVSSFKYRNHLCLVFESLCMNLRDLQKKFGRNIGLNLDVVRLYAKQLFRCFEASKELWLLGLPYDHSLDIWSVGCCLFGLYAGKVLFPGRSNNEMLASSYGTERSISEEDA
ncbi:Serine/threonine-protein kinase PRP4 [Datura stramonium]|uniref:Serine/threonine-protein kinase PRP4 n=1 Tax=Datura stramonium TaxID=4076 RepID=A0ABS8RR45_DATST|nr:Serine/threonine-protein kinase PRP4 [Datura stramonium]